MKAMIFYEIRKMLNAPKIAAVGAVILVFCCAVTFFQCRY